MEAPKQAELLQVLKRELVFLRNGGYRHPHRAQWRAHYVFEDSPSCLNFGDPQRSWPCIYCPLFAYVPEEQQATRIPCRHIPLNPAGETLDLLYRTASPEEIEAKVASWLSAEINRLERIQRNEEAQRASGAS